MNIVWFWMIAAMLATYAVLDGYDLGVGALHLWLARTEAERSANLDAIGPLWNGNEVWLIASGGLLIAVFPRLYAAAFSGFYLALMLVLWLLLLRGAAIEFRGHLEHPLWRQFWDAAFWLGSILLALLLGVALGNLLRGLPLNPDGYFSGSFALLLNPYALLTGLLSAAVLSWHGLNFLRTKADGALLLRARRWSRGAGWIALMLTLLATAATRAVWPQAMANYGRYPAALLLPALAVAGFVLARQSSDRRAFAGSTLVIGGLLATAAASLYPNLLRSIPDARQSLTAFNAATSPHGLRVAFVANGIALLGVVAYSLHIHRIFRRPQ